MNKQNPKMIDWCDFSWNPIKGLCKHNCVYCYMKRIYSRFKLDPKLRFDIKELNCKQPKKPSKIFVGSSHDVFGDWIPTRWIKRIIDVAAANPHNIYFFLTKNPKRYHEFHFPSNCWLGTSIDTQKRTVNIVYMKNNHPNKKFISFEPMLAEISITLEGFDWIIIGGDSNPGAAKPPDMWADLLIAEARKYNIPVWIKDNYKYRRIQKEFR